MPLLLPINSFLKLRYRFMFAALISVIIHGILSALYLKHYLLEKYGVSVIKISPDDFSMWNDCDRITNLSFLFYPAITLLTLIIFFLINKQRKEIRTGLLLYLLSLILVFGYLFYFSQSVVVYILPALMIIGAYSSHRGGFREASKVFILLFIILLLAYVADKLSMNLFSIRD